MTRTDLILCAPVKNHPETLSEYLKRICREKGINHVKISQKARVKGLSIHEGYVSNLLSGNAANPSAKKIKALAAGIDEPEEEVFAVAKGEAVKIETKFRDSMFRQLHEDYQKLPAKEQAEMRRSLEIIHGEIQRTLKRLNKP